LAFVRTDLEPVNSLFYGVLCTVIIIYHLLLGVINLSFFSSSLPVYS